jgi:hypothetical protein
MLLHGFILKESLNTWIMKECNLKEMCRLTVIAFLALIVMGVLMSLYSCGSYKSTMKQETSTLKVDSIRQIRDFGFTSMQDISSFLHSTTNRKMNWQLYDTLNLLIRIQVSIRCWLRGIPKKTMRLNRIQI